MIEVTCTACGNVNFVGDADLPVGAKFVNCASCKARVALATKTLSGGAATQVNPVADIDIADLPAPRRQSALGAEASKPAPRSGLAAAGAFEPELDPELPAPRSRRVSPAPSSGSVGIDLDDFLAPPGGVVDLPAPKARVPDVRAPIKPPPLASPPPLVDLPTPKGPSRQAAAAAPVPEPRAGIVDLPAPKPGGARGVVDLPAPKGPPAIPKPPPIPSAMTKPGIAGAPKLPASGAAPSTPGITDLPMPKPGGHVVDLPMPKAGTDLPAPKGFFDDLPQPSRGGQRKSDLPAPKGFFDDLPQPAKPGDPNLPAPKGFFEDLPGRPTNKPTEAIAPKGFFEDLPGRPNQSQQAKTTDVAPKGFFEDLPDRAHNKPTDAIAPKGFFDDLPQPSRNRVDSGKGIAPLVDLSPDGAPPLELDTGPALDLEAPTGAAGTGGYDDLDLSKPSTPVSRVESKRSSAQSPVEHEPLAPLARDKNADIALELEEPRQAPTSIVTPKLKKAKAVDTTRQPKKSRIKLLLLIGLLLGAAGGGAAFYYKRQQQQRETGDAIAKQLGKARTAFAASHPGHWGQAAGAATKVLDLSPAHKEALEIGAEAYLLSGLDDGAAAIRDIKKGRDLMARARQAGITGPAMERIQALSNIAINQPDSALAKLQPMFDKSPKDGRLALYLGWAHALRGDAESAIKAYDVAAETAQVKIAGLYGRGRARLAAGNLDGARTDFAAVLDTLKEHIGAQVGMAAAKPASEAQQQEADLRAITNIKGAEATDPRAVAWAHILIADLSRRAGRLDDARGSFNAALKLEPQNIAALTGLAEVELRDGKLDVASTTITKVLTQSANDVRAQLVAAEISIKQNKLDDAAKRIKALADRTPPPPVAERARLKLVTGMLFDAQKNDVAAADAYIEAAKLAGDRDLTPTLLAVAKLGMLADQADATDPAKAAELRAKADELLGSLAQNAEKDPQLALTLGTAYLQANDATKAEPWLRRAVEARPGDTEAQFQLAKAAARLGKHEEAIERLKTAFDLEPQRTEIGLELTRTYEASARDGDALALYDKLLEITTEPSVELRARAGRFYARLQKFDKAAEQGAKILAAQPQHPAGLFLKGEGILANAGTDKIKMDVARKLFNQAAETERDPQYLDGLGRACEAIAKDDQGGKGDLAMQDAAIRAYQAATALDPKMHNPLAGLGRLYVARREFGVAVRPLDAAFKIKPTAEIAHNMGVAHKEQQQHKDAIGWFQVANKIQPTADTYYHLAEVFRDEDVRKTREAAAAYTAAVKLAFEKEKQTGRDVEWLTVALAQLGYENMALGREREAAQAWRAHVARNPPASARLNEIREKLATELQRYQ